MTRQLIAPLTLALSGCSLIFSGGEHQTPRDAGGGMDAGGTDAALVDAGPVDAGPPPPCTTAADCDDSNECTTNDCVGEVCTFTNDDTITCSGGDGQCSAGACICDGCFDGTTCQPGSTAGACGAAGGTCMNCDDGLACTADLCAGSPPACEHLVLTGYCLIDGVCRAEGERLASNDCLACAPSTTQSGWSELGMDAMCTRQPITGVDGGLTYDGGGAPGNCSNRDGTGVLFCCGAYAAECDDSTDCCNMVPCIGPGGGGRAACRYP